MKTTKKLGLVGVLAEIKSGLSPAQISKKYNIPKQNISYFVGKLKKQRCIEKVGYGTWRYIRPLKEVKDLTSRQGNRSKQKEIRGHAFIWRIVFYNPYNWEKIIKNYQKKKLTFQRISSGKVLRTIFKNRKIWLSAKGMTIYEPLDFMGRSSFETKGKAVFEMDKLIKDLLKELGQKFRPYKFTTSREHYGIIKNELARQYNDKKQKMEIRSEDGDIWMWIDDSKGLGELENNDAPISRKVQNYWNNHKKHKFKVDADHILKNEKETKEKLKHHDQITDKAIRTLGKYDEQIALHLKVEERKLILTEKQSKQIDEQNKIFREIRDNMKGQSVKS